MENNNILHLVYIPFRGVGLDFRDDAWFEERIRIFKKYTLQSLKKQSCKDFILWLSFRPIDWDTYLVRELSEYLRKEDMRFIMTFDGLMYHDDKFSTDLWSRIKNIGRLIRWCYRNTWKEFIFHLIFMFKDKNSTLKERLSNSLEHIHQLVDKSDWVIMTRIDSDDMFHKDMIKNIQKSERFEGALVCKKGYIYNDSTGEMAEWNPLTNPPFYSIIFREDTFFDIDEHLDFYGNFMSHEDITKNFTFEELPDYSYCVLTHNPRNHISTIWNHHFRGKLVNRKLIKNYK